MPRDDQYHCLCCNPFHRGHRNIGFGMVVTGVFMICFQIAASTARAFGFRLNAGIWTGAMVSEVEPFSGLTALGFAQPCTQGSREDMPFLTLMHEKPLRQR